MTAARLRALFAGVIVVIGVLIYWMFATSRSPSPLPPRPSSERPRLLLLTSLPLMFGEQFSLRDGGSGALKVLGSRYTVVPISVTDASELGKGRLLLMAHPLAQPPEDLVALDAWVRGGGHLLLLADPLLEWPSGRPLGDPLRPPAMFMDTGLLQHWGLRLDAPDVRGPARRRLGGTEIATLSPGLLYGACAIQPDRLVARCKIGRGRATIVADADFLDAARLGDAAKPNLNALVSELAVLEQP